MIILALLIISGCSAKEIDTGEKDCREMMTGMFGSMMDVLADSDCTNLCQVEGYSYKQWKCSEQDTLVCVCV